MKILHVTSYLPGHHELYGGAEQAAYQQIMALQAHGVDNIVVTLKEDFSMPEEFKYYQLDTLETYLGNWAGNGANFRKAISTINQRILYYDPVPKNRFRLIIQQEKPDLINFYNFRRLSFSLLSVAQDLSLPCVLSIYDYWYFCPHETLIKKNHQLCYNYHGGRCFGCYTYKNFNFLLRWLLFFRKPLFDRFLKKFAAFLVLSDSSRHLLEKYGIAGEKIKTIPQFYQPPNSKTLPPTNSQKTGDYILFTGWLNHKKGLHLLVKAMQEVCSRVKSVKLLILGMEADPKYLMGIKDYIAENGLAEHIAFAGKVTPEECISYLRQAKLLVVPEQWENMSPVIIVEAMFNGIPVVASRIGGIPEFVFDGKNGFLAQPDAPHDFADKIVKLLSNPRLQEEFSRENQALSRKIFDNKANLERLLGVYKRVLVN